jgi:uncharacterized protein (UPF0332 family)/predicted nucleotidyltransferase
MATVARSSLSETERRTLDRAVELLRERLGDELISVWLYGSRARGETPRHEDSDVDLMVVVGNETGTTRMEVRDLLYEAAKSAGGEEFAFASMFQTVVVDPAFLAQKRSIAEFFIAEVDRDKLVLFGDPEGGTKSLAGVLPDAVEKRTEEYLQTARKKLDSAHDSLEIGGHEVVAHLAYYAVFHAARAALSSEDEFARTHSGVWDRFHVRFVADGPVAVELAAKTRKLETLRLDVDYYGIEVSKREATGAVETATAFLAAVEQLLDTP